VPREEPVPIAPPEAEPAPPAPAPAAKPRPAPPAPAAKPRPAAPPEPPPARDDDPDSEVPEADEAREEPAARPREPFKHRPVFIGLGVLAGSGYGSGPGRAGGTLRAGWHGASGWQLVTSFCVAWRISEEPYTAAWVSLEAGAGYRWSLSDAVSVGALLSAGAERARFEVLAAGVSRSEASLTPRVGLGVDVRWRATQSFGAWASGEGRSSGRGGRLFVAPDREPIPALPIDLALLAGVGWWLE